MTGSAIWDGLPKANMLEPHLHLDIAYTPVPPSAQMHPEWRNDPHASFWGLAMPLFDEGREHALAVAGGRTTPSESVEEAGLHGRVPEHNFACFDVLYYVSAEDVCFISLFDF